MSTTDRILRIGPQRNRGEHKGLSLSFFFGRRTIGLVFGRQVKAADCRVGGKKPIGSHVIPETRFPSAFCVGSPQIKLNCFHAKKFKIGWKWEKKENLLNTERTTMAGLRLGPPSIKRECLSVPLSRREQRHASQTQ